MKIYLISYDGMQTYECECVNPDASIADWDEITKDLVDQGVHESSEWIFNSGDKCYVYEDEYPEDTCWWVFTDQELDEEAHTPEEVEVVDAKKPRPADETTEAATEEATEAVTDKETEVETNEATEAVTDTETEADNGSTTTAEATETEAPEIDYKTASFPGWAIAIIAAAGAVLVAAIIVIIAKNKKK